LLTEKARHASLQLEQSDTWPQHNNTYENLPSKYSLHVRKGGSQVVDRHGPGVAEKGCCATLQEMSLLRIYIESHRTPCKSVWAHTLSGGHYRQSGIADFRCHSRNPVGSVGKLEWKVTECRFHV